MDTNGHCLLCEAINDTVNNGENSKIENRLLYSSNSFIITPCISPLVPGHILITSRNHYQNLSCMSTESILEINELLEFITSQFPEYYSNLIIAEHGAYDFEQNSGACIIHTHLHVIPESKDSLNAFDKLLDSIEVKNIIDIKGIDYPYILVVAEGIIKIFQADNVPSQMIRRAVLASKGETKNWDWRLRNNNKFNDQTLKIWQNE